MPNPIMREHNTETNEVIDREMSDDEYKAYKATAKEAEVQEAIVQAKELAKTALLEKLGITAEEAALLLA
jgi:hypothetical protein